MTVPPQQPRVPPALFPPAPQTRTLSLPGGASIAATADLPGSLSDQCTVSMNLMLQLGPFLGSMECVIKLLEAMTWVLDFVPSIPDPIKMAQKIEELPPIAEGVINCFTAWTPLGYCAFIKDVLIMIADFVRCAVEMLESVLVQNLELGVRMGDAQGNPELLEVLDAAQANADRMQELAANSMGPAFALLDTVGAFLSALGGGAIEVPSIDDLTGGEIDSTLQILRDLESVIRGVAEALPC